MCTGPGGRGSREKKEQRPVGVTEMAQVTVKDVVSTGHTGHTGTPPPQALFFQKQMEAPVSEGLWHRHQSKTTLSAFLRKERGSSSKVEFPAPKVELPVLKVELPALKVSSRPPASCWPAMLAGWTGPAVELEGLSPK